MLPTYEELVLDETLDADFVMPEPWQKQGDYAPKVPARTEAELQTQCANYLRRCYPQVVFHHDAHAAVDVHVTKAVAAKAAGTCKGWPDLAIMLPRSGYAGMFVELKRPGLRLYKVRSGEPYNNHFAAQLAVHRQLEAAGYKVAVVQDAATFAAEVDKYMGAGE